MWSLGTGLPGNSGVWPSIYCYREHELRQPIDTSLVTADRAKLANDGICARDLVGQGLNWALTE